MIDLTTSYLGLNLANPLVPSASPLSKEIDTALELEDAGASALIMYSLFEEMIDAEDQHLERFFGQQSIGHAEASSFHPVPATYSRYQDNYLEQLTRLKSRLGIPVIASLNGVTTEGWINYARELEQAGADALEMNVYYIAASPDETGLEVENRYLDILQRLRDSFKLPITMKLSSQFSSITHIAKKMEVAGANGLALFNRFYQPDIDLETLRVVPKLKLSSPEESLLRIRWVALLYGHINMSIAVTGGFHNTDAVLKAILAGADVVHLCSELLDKGPGRITTMLQELAAWLELKEYESIRQMKGSLSQRNCIDPAAYERANYIDVIDSYSASPGVMR